MCGSAGGFFRWLEKSDVILATEERAEHIEAMRAAAEAARQKAVEIAEAANVEITEEQLDEAASVATQYGREKREQLVKLREQFEADKTKTRSELEAKRSAQRDALQASNPVQVVPANAWQAARSLGDYSLVSCCVGPGFDFCDFEMARQQPTTERPKLPHPELI